MSDTFMYAIGALVATEATGITNFSGSNSNSESNPIGNIGASIGSSISQNMAQVMRQNMANQEQMLENVVENMPEPQEPQNGLDMGDIAPLFSAISNQPSQSPQPSNSGDLSKWLENRLSDLDPRGSGSDPGSNGDTGPTAGENDTTSGSSNNDSNTDTDIVDMVVNPKSGVQPGDIIGAGFETTRGAGDVANKTTNFLERGAAGWKMVFTGEATDPKTGQKKSFDPLHLGKNKGPLYNGPDPLNLGSNNSNDGNSGGIPLPNIPGMPNSTPKLPIERDDEGFGEDSFGISGSSGFLGENNNKKNRNEKDQKIKPEIDIPGGGNLRL